MTTPDALGTASIEHLDFKHVQSCEHSNHANHPGDQPAMFLVRARCPHCAVTRTIFLCLPGWERGGVLGISHPCGARRLPRAACWTILRVVGSVG